MNALSNGWPSILPLTLTMPPGPKKCTDAIHTTNVHPPLAALFCSLAVKSLDNLSLFSFPEVMAFSPPFICLSDHRTRNRHAAEKFFQGGPFPSSRVNKEPPNTRVWSITLEQDDAPSGRNPRSRSGMLADFAVPIRPCVRIAEIHSERHRAPPNGDSYSL